MGNKMLIDAAHPEETRVVVLRGNRIEEFDFEAANKRQLRGNIYLAKVTRVEPSLQAAFIEYGGNRHGFLAFSEIHPDYYQIPVADRQQLLEDEARSAQEDEEEPRSSGKGRSGGNGNSSGSVSGSGEGNGNAGHRRSRRHRRGGGSAEKRAWAPRDESVSSGDLIAADATDTSGEDLSDGSEAVPDSAGVRLDSEHESAPQSEFSGETEDSFAADEAGASPENVEAAIHAEVAAPVVAEDDGSVDTREAEAFDPEQIEQVAASADEAEADAPLASGEDAEVAEEDAHESDTHEDEQVEQLGGDALEDVPHRVSRPRRNYKIQEVIKRRQVLLVQVVKEERGNKGAALTTYLSLAGRYSVLMPNTARGGGISRKIVDAEDRKRLKAIVQELEVPDGMGIILRTAGAARGMPEVKRDFEYLMRMWETVRETTLESSAPTLVYEEGSLIKRSIRDLFTKDVDEVVVAGETAYREAKDFMRLLMPNHVRNVVAWRDPQPIFAKSGAEAQLDAMFSNQVVLKSGGYLVINQTEALVAIDVNSGRSTREHNIEDTALRTNLEAADEVARQLRLRDLAGLIVVDFIDMEEGRNDRAVERRLKDALKDDRARIQLGRISHFGLLEMSRQRMRTGVVEGSTVLCAHCAGAGTVRSMSSMALHVLRVLEETLIRSAASNLIARTRSEVALYILNQKRANLYDLESRFGVSISVLADPGMMGMVYHAIERGTDATPPQAMTFRQQPEELVEEEFEGEEQADDTLEEGVAAVEGEEATGASGAAEADGEGGRRRRRRRRRRGRDGREQVSTENQTEGADGAEEVSAGEEEGEAAAEAMEDSGDIGDGSPTPEEAPVLDEPVAIELVVNEPILAEPVAVEPDLLSEPAASGSEASPTDEVSDVEPPRRRRSRRTARPAESTAEASPVDVTASPVEDAPPARKPRRSRRTAEAEVAPEKPAADRDVGADTAERHPPLEATSEPELPLAQAVPDGSPSPEAPAETEGAAAAEVSPPAPVEPEPDRAKRSGWWQRAKATFTTES